eukprot:gene41186-28420_t
MPPKFVDQAKPPKVITIVGAGINRINGKYTLLPKKQNGKFAWTGSADDSSDLV